MHMADNWDKHKSELPESKGYMIVMRNRRVYANNSRQRGHALILLSQLFTLALW